MAVTTALYLGAYWGDRSMPPSSGWKGHGIGVAGFILMLMTETLYSLRKQTASARWGSMAAWLRFHMVTGIVGPYLVLLHTALHFRGLAGVVMLLTFVVVISGLVGRYLYTAIPHADDGNELLPAEPSTQEALSGVGIGGVSGLGSAALAVTPAVTNAAPYADVRTQSELQGPRLEAGRLSAARSALGTWRAVHLPLTSALFILAFVHVIGALYYATLQR